MNKTEYGYTKGYRFSERLPGEGYGCCIQSRLGCLARNGGHAIKMCIIRIEGMGAGCLHSSNNQRISGVTSFVTGNSERKVGEVDVSDVTEFPWGSFVYFSDPDGNGWALQQLPAGAR